MSKSYEIHSGRRVISTELGSPLQAIGDYVR